MTPKNQWYKYYPLDFQFGTQDLTLEQRGAYQAVLNLIYMHQGPVADNDRWIAGQLNISTRKWRSLKAALLSAGKLMVADGTIDNVRARTEIESALSLRRKYAESGAKGARIMRENQAVASQNRDLPPAGPEDSESDSDPEIRSQNQSPEPPAPRGRRLSTDWQPTQGDQEFARSKGLQDAEITDIAARFRDYWTAQPGARGIRTDWSATWRNWIRREQDPPARHRGTGRSGPASGKRHGAPGDAGGGGALDATRRLLAQLGPQPGSEPGGTGAARSPATGGSAHPQLPPGPTRPSDAD